MKFLKRDLLFRVSFIRLTILFMEYCIGQMTAVNCVADTGSIEQYRSALTVTAFSSSSSLKNGPMIPPVQIAHQSLYRDERIVRESTLDFPSAKKGCSICLRIHSYRNKLRRS